MGAGQLSTLPVGEHDGWLFPAKLIVIVACDIRFEKITIS